MKHKYGTPSFAWVMAISLAMSLALTPPSYASEPPATIAYQGRILKNNLPLEANPVAFRITVFSPNDCVLYEEEHAAIDMTGSNGVFDISIGSGSKAFAGNRNPAAATLKSAMKNFGSFTGLTCLDGSTTTYTPTAGDSRKIHVEFDDGASFVAITPDHIIQSSPYAFYAQSAKELDGVAASGFIKVNGAKAVTQTNLEAIFDSAASVTKLQDLIAGTSSLYTSAGGGNFTPASNLDFNAKRITNLADPTSAQDATTKNYTDANIGGKSVAAAIGSLGAGDTGKVLSWDGAAGKWTVTDPVANTSVGGDLSGTLPNPTVAKIQTKPVSSTAPGSGQVLKFDGTSWAPASLGASDLKNGLGNAQFSSSCASHQTMVWNALTDTFTCTNINMSNIASGTLPVSRGGTGSTNGSITGSGALTFAAGGTDQNITLTPSGTGSTILNGLVGIGTTSPTANLTLFDSTNSATGLDLLSTGTGTDQQSVLTLYTKTDGSGIGAAASKGWQLYARGNAWTTASERNDFGLSYWSGTTWTTPFAIDSATGNVGIGTQSPIAKLEVNGSDASTTFRVVNTTSSVSRSPEIALMNYMGSAGSGNPQLIFYNYQGTESGGRTPAQADDRLGSIQGAGFTTSSTSIGASIDFNTSNVWTATDSAGYIAFNTTSPNTLSPTEKMRLTEKGVLGIGGTPPSWLAAGSLYTSGHLVVDGQINAADGSPGAAAYDFRGNSGGMGMYRIGANVLGFSTNGTERVRVDASGNVGIGVTSPQAMLDLNGDIRLKVNGSAPVACSATYKGRIALTSTYKFCVCKGGSNAWVLTTDGSSACTW